jgi:RimJ/RimL family protein N-acetyltransferase
MIEVKSASLPVGEPVEAIRAERPGHVILPGRIVSVVPLDPEKHARALYDGSHGAEAERLWAYLFDGPYTDFASFQDSLRQKAASNDPLFFTVLDNASGCALGYAAYMRIEPAHRVIEIGSILYLPALQQTVGATEAMYLLAKHAFEDLHYRRYEWKCNALNEPSRRAARRLGFTFEGVFRQHMIVKGRNRDTAWFSMLNSEWPARKAAFERWLSPANFDGSGTQIESLSGLNGANSTDRTG